MSIKILDSSLTELATIAAATSAVRLEKINSDNTLKFSVRVKSGYGDYITDTSVFELDGDYFDIAYYKKEQKADGKLLISVEAEHVSYRLNKSAYNVEYFTEIGTPTAILTEILDGTGFTVGTVDFSDLTTFSIQQASSRRGVLMQFAAYMEGELEFNGFSISLLTQRGSATPKALTIGQDVTVISKAVDRRHLDSSGNPTVAYKCGVYKGSSLSLGDVVQLDYSAMSNGASLRVVSKAHAPYNPNSVTVEIGNYINSLEDDLYRIETQAVKKDALMNGTRIGPEYGFEAVRNDKKARAYFKSDGMAFQAGDGSGENWVDKIYFDPVLGKYIFDGELSANIINALSVLISPNLYARKATIIELTVDQLDTSDKVQKYLSNDDSDDNFQRIFDQYHEFITAQTDGLETNKAQALNRNAEPLYWTDGTYTSAGTDVTAWPVYTFAYEEFSKMKIGFDEEPSSGHYVPMIEMGAGSSEESETMGKAYIYKGADGLYIDHYSETNDELCRIVMDRFVDAKMRRINAVNINKTAGNVSVLMEGETTPATLTYTEDATSMTFTWPDAHVGTISIS